MHKAYSTVKVTGLETISSLDLRLDKKINFAIREFFIEMKPFLRSFPDWILFLHTLCSIRLRWTQLWKLKVKLWLWVCLWSPFLTICNIEVKQKKHTIEVPNNKWTSWLKMEAELNWYCFMIHIFFPTDLSLSTFY